MKIEIKDQHSGQHATFFRSESCAQATCKRFSDGLKTIETKHWAGKIRVTLNAFTLAMAPPATEQDLNHSNQ